MRRFWHWLTRRNRPVHLEECEVCGRKLKPKEVHELREDFSANDEERSWGGGSYMVATYCAEHFPGK